MSVISGEDGGTQSTAFIRFSGERLLL
uniref:Uncharacterized protein n=1 Tax=Rhizophora mucronata TaxID=61149 RepID=A0A2P2QUN5_RHIMU